MESKKKLAHIESIRAFAALSVALFHFTNYYNGNHFLISNEGVRDVFVYGAQGVEMFYLISGFIIPYSLYKGRYRINHYFHYLAKRLSRLLPPYFITIFLIILVGYGLTTFLWGGTYDFKWRQIFMNAFFMVDLVNMFDGLSSYFPDNTWINPIFATLKVELQFYLLIGLVFPWMNKSNVRLVILAIFLLAAGVYTQTMDTMLVNSPYFILGMVAFYIFERGWNWYYAVTLFLTFATLFTYYQWQDITVAALAFSLVLWLPVNFRFLNFTGKISYSYYLVHGLTGGWFLYFTSDTTLSQEMPWLMIFFALLISWIGAFLMYICIEKPSLYISKSIKYKTDEKT